MTYRFSVISRASKLSANLYDIYHCCVYSKKTPDDEQRNCPKHVDFYSKNKVLLQDDLLDWSGGENRGHRWNKVTLFRNIGQRHGIAGANQSFTNAAMLKHFGTVVTKHHCIHEDVRADQSTEMSPVAQLGSCSSTPYVKWDDNSTRKA